MLTAFTDRMFISGNTVESVRLPITLSLWYTPLIVRIPQVTPWSSRTNAAPATNPPARSLKSAKVSLSGKSETE